MATEEITPPIGGSELLRIILLLDLNKSVDLIFIEPSLINFANKL